MKTTISEINEGGTEVSLMNCSNWLVPLAYVTKTLCWYPTQRIELEDNGDGSYTLTNLDTATQDKIIASRM